MSRAQLVILHAPGYAPAWTLGKVRRAERLRAHSIAYSEAYAVADELVDRDGLGRDYHPAIVGGTTTDSRAVRSMLGDAGDNPMSVRADCRLIGWRAPKVTDVGDPTKYAPERFVVRGRFEWEDETATHVSAHPSPLFAGRAEWEAVMDRAITECVVADERGDLVVLTGDFQTRRLFLRRKLRKAGLRVVKRSHVDYVCVNRRLRKRRARVIRVRGFDHPWLLAHLERA